MPPTEQVQLLRIFPPVVPRQIAERFKPAALAEDSRRHTKAAGQPASNR